MWMIFPQEDSMFIDSGLCGQKTDFVENHFELNVASGHPYNTFVAPARFFFKNLFYVAIAYWLF